MASDWSHLAQIHRITAIKGTPNIHGEILEALQQRDGEAAAAALRKDLESAFKAVLPLLPE